MSVTPSDAAALQVADYGRAVFGRGPACRASATPSSLPAGSPGWRRCPHNPPRHPPARSWTSGTARISRSGRGAGTSGPSGTAPSRGVPPRRIRRRATPFSCGKEGRSRISSCDLRSGLLPTTPAAGPTRGCNTAAGWSIRPTGSSRAIRRTWTPAGRTPEASTRSEDAAS